MDYLALKTEFAARGYDYLSTTRAGYYINRGYHEFLERHPWPFAEKEVTAQNAPVTLSDLSAVVFAVDTTNDVVLYGDDLRTIRERDPDLSQTGNPHLWFLENLEFNVYPVNTTASLTIRYLYSPSDLSRDTDEPIVPSRYQIL